MVLLSPVKTLIYSIAFLSLVIFMPKLQTSLTRSALHLASISVKPITQRIPPFTIIPPPGRIATRISGISLPFALFSSSSKSSAGEDKMGGEHAVKKSDTEWRAVLSPEQFRVLRKQGTEAPGSHAYDKKSPSDKGVYHCAGCDAPLYTSNTKFKSGCGWPAFYDTIPGAVDRHEDTSMFMKRIEITCHNCGGHLGHVFQGEGYQTPTDERHCVNGISLNFKDEK